MARTKKTRRTTPPEQTTLFALPPPAVVEPELKKPKHPVWTENKALLIQRYLFYFVLVTKHGTYIDGFAGPQEPDKPRMWAARLVLESRPRWLRQLVFVEANSRKVKALRSLVEAQPAREKKEPRREVEILPGDCNVVVPQWLQSGKLKQSDATFCLLDQRTFECDWETVQAVAGYRVKNFKIEQFYFLANAWLERAIAGAKTKGKARIAQWWGRDDWGDLRKLDAWGRANLLCKRFRDELGYKSAKAWPIYEKPSGGKIMYFMIHATDHPEAPKLMARAYNRAVHAPEPVEQLTLDALLSTPPDKLVPGVNE